jgi:hypothetical protein
VARRRGDSPGARLKADSGRRADRLAARGHLLLAKLTRMSRQEADAADAWQRIYAFFGEHLDDNLAG